ncbi:MAG TPA: translocation/assembly module TamB domain-containing protein, partial [Saprospiraceae bacterium]|nr:translocation/assembly module TamB domain-containing protein [Saprospiraceae bacterium]
DTHVNLFLRYARGIAAFGGDLAVPSPLDASRTSGSSNELSIALSGNFEMAHLAAPLWWNMKLRYSTQRSNERSPLRITGAWLPKADDPAYVEEVDMTVKPGEFQTRVEASNFPLAVLETFIPGITGTEGRMAADVRLGGPFSRFGMNGYADIQQGKFQIDYLKTPFYIRNQRITLTDYRIWAEGDTIWDASIDRNMAIVHGGLMHNHFKDWRLAAQIECRNDRFVILNTLPDDNELFYGTGAGSFNAAFSGTFARSNIDITATTGDQTRLFIPLSSTTDAKEVGFINFVDKSKKDTLGLPAKRPQETELKGLNFDLNLTITDKAEVQLIFDEQAGDIIKGRGTGDVQISINRQGEFKMYGNYFIDRGEYLFTLLNFVNKPFVVTQGGSIAWYGDPYGAQINLDATYTENTPVYNFLRDELQLLEATDENLATLAGKSTRVVVTMHLKGDLMKPTITFDLDFPNLPTQLKNLADNKLRQMRQDPNELNRQVFGLVVVGSFLPGNSGFIQSSTYIASAFNTLTQVFTNQLSNYLTGLATEWFGGTVSSIDFDIAYNDYQSALSNPGGSTGVTQAGRELQVRLTSGFVNDRITIQFGSQFGFARPGTNVQDGFLGEDITVEIQLTDSRQWKLKVYQRTEPDVGGGQRRARYGFGITFHRDYDSFDEMMSSLTKVLKRK